MCPACFSAMALAAGGMASVGTLAAVLLRSFRSTAKANQSQAQAKEKRRVEEEFHRAGNEESNPPFTGKQ